MNGKEFLKKLDELKLPCDSFYILGRGALLLYGVIKETVNVELCISPRLFNWLVLEKRIEPDNKDENGFYKILDFPDIEVVVNDKIDFRCVRIGDGDFMLEDIRYILEYKKKKNKVKDRKDIEGIENFLQKYPNYPNF